MPAFAEKENAYDRVMRTGEIRCGYFVASPYVDKDPNTGEMSGVWYELTEALAKELGFKVVWNMELGLGDLFNALDTGKIDVYCGGLWVNPDRAKRADFTMPVSYKTVDAYVRQGDSRFDGNKQAINSQEISVAYIDGEMASLISKRDFPNAKILSFPQLSPLTEPLIAILNKKADVTFTSREIAEQLNKTHDEGLKKVPLAHPIRVFPEVLAVKKGEHNLRMMLNYVLEFVINTGTYEEILQKYEAEPGTYYRLSKPYEVSQRE